MVTATNILVLLAMMAGTVGIVVPVLPGLLLVYGAFLVWAIDQPDHAGWLPFGIVTLVYAAGMVAKYLFPGRRLRTAGVETWIIGIALVVAVVGLFVLPVVGAPIGFVVSIYLLQLLQRRAHGPAWSATRQALLALGLSVALEMATALTMISVWGVSVWLGSS